MGKTKRREKREDDAGEYESMFVLPGCTFGSLLSPAGRSAMRIADALMAEKQKEVQRNESRSRR